MSNAAERTKLANEKLLGLSEDLEKANLNEESAEALAEKKKWLESAFQKKKDEDEPAVSGAANPGSDLVKDRMAAIWGKKEEEKDAEPIVTGNANPGSDLANDRKKWLESAFQKKSEDEEPQCTGSNDPGHDLVKDRTNKIWGPKEEKEEESLPFGVGDIVLIDNDKKAYFIKKDSDGNILVRYLVGGAQESVEMSRCRAG